MGESSRGAPTWAPDYRHLTGDVEPIPFQFRVRPQDFQVVEVPSEEPSGEGTHTYLEIEKRRLSTLDAVGRLARALGRPEREFGFAGRKDAYAVTRQWISIEHVDSTALEQLEIPDVTVLRLSRHTKKLRLGHLAGNRFRLRLCQVADGDRGRMSSTLERLARTGIPNYYGAQRFGRHGVTYRLGRLLVERRTADYLAALLSPEHTAQTPAVEELREVFESGSPGAQRGLTRLAGRLPSELSALARQLARRPGDFESALRAISARTLRFHLSSFQSRIFNRVLASRIAEGLGIERAHPGDVLIDHVSGRTTRLPAGTPVDGARLEGLARFETSPSGPMPGARSLVAEGRPGELEEAAIVAEGLAPADFANLPDGIAQNGARRPLRAPLTELSLSWSSGAVDLHFRLPKGAFATTLLEELRKDFRPV